MDNINSNIQCSVNTCTYHADVQDYCTLNAIKVGCCAPQPKSCDCTECASFKAKKGGSCAR